jgi:hypothetical protein
MGVLTKNAPSSRSWGSVGSLTFSGQENKSAYILGVCLVPIATLVCRRKEFLLEKKNTCMGVQTKNAHLPDQSCPSVGSLTFSGQENKSAYILGVCLVPIATLVCRRKEFLLEKKNTCVESKENQVRVFD